ncbi:PQQ-dependent sugar dehydrogenase [Gordonia neofelifaecis]|uniref:Glucose/sorbosone dehydrogenase-like protein n=1 Tax=Gordonia neofelifaecis NRRL B-59395 TaxID=644548 RepID=F1YEX7_9ACTN|nr:PQQ-dependent sugar dehydrogenase [Gordonia neofelifaecis]EGD56960.1 glucose/sorbosone dehydrogenase-like protein [Gordonia neofelifaecis NRRL B-59395]
MPSHSRAARRALLAVTSAIAVALAATGCADFSQEDQAADQGSFTAPPTMERAPQQAPQPPSDDQGGGPPPTGPCVDPDPAVIATCLASTGGVRPADPSGRTTYVAERTTGKIILSKRYGPQRVVASVDVDGSGDGGLIDFEMSPTYVEDQMIYALVTTGSDNRVVRIAPTGSVKPILTGIPKGATGNMGSISFASPTELVVATGDAGDPAAASDRGSLAGKIFSIDPNVADPKPDIRATGLGSDVALCPSPGADGQLFVADSGAAGDRLSLVGPKGLQTLWTWPDRPGVSGCAVGDSWIAVSVAGAKRIDTFIRPANGSLTVGRPNPQDFSKTYGAVGRMTALGGQATQLATVNKATSGAPVKSYDDRVAIYMPKAGEDLT